MNASKGGCVYIITNTQHTGFYTGVTSDIVTRIWQHINKIYPKSFTAKYNCTKLVYYQPYAFIEEAIAAEKAIKGGSRQNKINLIKALNPEFKDLYSDLI
jgi:putative endonuclease